MTARAVWPGQGASVAGTGGGGRGGDMGFIKLYAVVPVDDAGGLSSAAYD